MPDGSGSSQTIPITNARGIGQHAHERARRWRRAFVRIGLCKGVGGWGRVPRRLIQPPVDGDARRQRPRPKRGGVSCAATATVASAQRAAISETGDLRTRFSERQFPWSGHGYPQILHPELSARRSSFAASGACAGTRTPTAVSATTAEDFDAHGARGCSIHLSSVGQHEITRSNALVRGWADMSRRQNTMRAKIRRGVGFLAAIVALALAWPRPNDPPAPKSRRAACRHSRSIRSGRSSTGTGSSVRSAACSSTRRTTTCGFFSVPTGSRTMRTTRRRSRRSPIAACRRRR